MTVSCSVVPDEIVETAVRLSGGYVKLAMFMFTTLLRAPALPLQELAKLHNIRQFLQRFISESNFKTLKVFSLLAKVGWRDDRRREADALARELNLQISDMEEAVAKLRDQGVIIERGFSLYVSPDLLAISAAAAMWEEKGPELIQIVTTLPGPGPKRQLLRRLATMHQHPTVIEAVEMLLGPKGWFQSIEHLDQEFLSEVFRFFASTLPLAALAVLERIIPSTPLDRLRSFRTGRREVVWAIESLLRWPETSLRAARILIRLALAENEGIANNATGITKIFFHAFLSGSPLPLLERLSLAKEILSSEQPGSRLLAVRAAAGALAFFESRTGGETDPISRRSFPKEWRPETWDELWKARRFAVNLLWEIATGEDDAGAQARKELLSAVSTLIRDGQLEDAISILRRFQPRTDEERLEYLERIQRIFKLEGIQLTEEQSGILISLREALFPDTLFDQIRRWAGKRSWTDYDQKGDGFTKADQICANLADRIASEGLSDDGWNWLGSPAAENVWSFGRRLGLIDAKNALLDKIISVSPRSLNPLLLASYLSGKPDEQRDDILDELAVTEEIIAFAATWRNAATVRSGIRILRLMDSVPLDFWSVLRYGNWVNPLPDDIKKPILHKMLSRPEGAEAGSSLITHLALSNREWAAANPDLIWVALSVLPKGAGSEWEWGQLAQMGIEIDPQRSAELALRFLLEDTEVHLSSHPAVQALAEASKRQPARVWRIVGPALLEKGIPAHRLLLSLRHWYGELIPVEELKEWARRNGKRGRIVVSELIHITAPLPERARALVLEFPDDDGLLNAFAAQLFTGSWTGPISGHTEVVLKMIELLEKDPNPRVSAWASMLKEGTSKQLARERLQEEDEEI